MRTNCTLGVDVVVERRSVEIHCMPFIRLEDFMVITVNVGIISPGSVNCDNGYSFPSLTVISELNVMIRYAGRKRG